ncbi:hypothetical protein DIPPA_33272 [Diplonema papillatum]|nr:hypothetical protein DIPPA_33272 [Diplonema papillatum]
MAWSAATGVFLWAVGLLTVFSVISLLQVAAEGGLYAWNLSLVLGGTLLLVFVQKTGMQKSAVAEASALIAAALFLLRDVATWGRYDLWLGAVVLLDTYLVEGFRRSAALPVHLLLILGHLTLKTLEEVGTVEYYPRATWLEEPPDPTGSRASDAVVAAAVRVSAVAAHVLFLKVIRLGIEEGSWRPFRSLCCWTSSSLSTEQGYPLTRFESFESSTPASQFRPVFHLFREFRFADAERLLAQLPASNLRYDVASLLEWARYRLSFLPDVACESYRHPGIAGEVPEREAPAPPERGNPLVPSASNSPRSRQPTTASSDGSSCTGSHTSAILADGACVLDLSHVSSSLNATAEKPGQFIRRDVAVVFIKLTVSGSSQPQHLSVNGLGKPPAVRVSDEKIGDAVKLFYEVILEASEQAGGLVHEFGGTTAFVAFGSAVWVSNPLAAAVAFAQNVQVAWKKHAGASEAVSSVVNAGKCRVGFVQQNQDQHQGRLCRRSFAVFGPPVDAARIALPFAASRGYTTVVCDSCASLARHVAHIKLASDAWQGVSSLHEVLGPAGSIITSAQSGVNSFQISIATGGFSQATGDIDLDASRVLGLSDPKLTSPGAAGSPSHHESSGRLLDQATQFLAVGDLTTAGICLQQALDKLPASARPACSIEVRDILHGMCLIKEMQGDWNDVLATRGELLSMETTLHGGSPHPDVAAAEARLGITCEKLFKLKRAAAHHKRAIDIYQALGDVEGVLQGRINLGVTYIKEGALNVAFAPLNSALEQLRSMPGGSEKLLAEVLYMLSVVYSRRKADKEARMLLEESAATGYLVLPDTPAVLHTSIAHAKACCEAGMFDSAAKQLSSLRRTTSVDPLVSAFLLCQEAAVHVSGDSLNEASVLYAEALSIRQRVLSHPGHPLIQQCILCLAHIALALGDEKRSCELTTGLRKLPKYSRATAQITRELETAVAQLQQLQTLTATPSVPQTP